MNDPSKRHPNHSKGARALRSFGRTGGRPLSPKRAALLRDVLPRIKIPLERDVDVRELFGVDRAALWLEVGFGGGEHLAAQAARNPDIAMIGAEPFVEGVTKLLAEIHERELTNLRLHPGDVRDILPRLPAESIDRVFVLFPDPWPKTRHRKRRLINPDFVHDLAHVLRTDARVRFATDIADYAEQALEVLLRDGRFSWQAERANDWRTPPADHVQTRYERKRLGDCAPVYLDFVFSGGSPE